MWCRGGESNTRRQPLPSCLDYLILLKRRSGARGGIIVGAHPLVSTPFPQPFVLRDLARDCLVDFTSLRVSPNSPDFSVHVPVESPEDPGLRSTTELPRHLFICVNIIPPTIPYATRCGRTIHAILVHVRTCRLCGNQFKDYQRRGRVRCGSCNTKIRRYRAKAAAVKYLGGKCIQCGWDKNQAALQFHHKNPKEKEFVLANVANKSWDTIKQELKKCVLLCANCHTTLHSTKEDPRLIEEADRYHGRILDF